MKRVFLELLLCSVAVQAQVNQNVHDPQPHAAVPQLSSFQRFSELRQGRQQEILIVPCMSDSACSGCPFTVKPRQLGLVPVEFELDSPKDLSVSYRAGRRYRPVKRGEAVHIAPDNKVIALKIHAGNNVPLGNQIVRGRLIFETQDQSKTSQQSLSFEVPIVVVGHDASVSQTDWPYRSRFGEHAKTVLMAPVNGVMFLLFAMACGTGACDI